MYPRIIDFGTIDLFGRSIPLAIHSYGVMIALGFFAVWYGLDRELPRKGYDQILAYAIIYSAFFGGLFGAKLYYVIEFKRFDFASGFVWYGGLIGGSVFVLIIIIRANQPVWSVLDSVGCLLLLGYGIGRIGCFLAGDGCYGRPGEFPWCVTFPEALSTHFYYQDQLYYVTSNVANGIPEHAILTPVHPTPIYETIISCISFGLLWSIRLKLEKRTGVLFGLSLLAMGVERFMVEFWRINTKYFWDYLSGAQAISLVLVTISILIVMFRWSNSSSSQSSQ